MDPIESSNLYKDGHSRVINVMDTIKISYDGSDYFGSFATLSLNDVAETPYRMEYTIEFMIACFGPDFDKIDGHVKKNGNELKRLPVYAVQGQNVEFDEVVKMDNNELKKWFENKRVSTLSEAGTFSESNFEPSKGTFLQADNVPKAWDSLIDEAAEKYSTAEYPIDPNLVAAVIAQESRGNQFAKSKAGAKGLMQLMDSTAAGLGVKDSYDPRENVMGGTKYLAQLIKKYNGNVSFALAAYNGGPTHFDSHNHDISLMKPETQNYVRLVIGFRDHYATSEATKAESAATRSSGATRSF
jgi:hypothetical protein